MTLRVREDGAWQPVGGSGPAPGPGYQRPYDWLPLPELDGSDRQLSMLVAVTPFESNYLSLVCAGDYQVDWGDGSVTQHMSHSRADHQYSFDELPAESWCSRGYRQAVVTVTPTTESWTTINLDTRNAAWVPTTNTSYSVLDVVVAGSTLTNFSLGGWERRAYMLEQFRQVGAWSRTNFDSMFQYCSSLQSVPELDTSGGTNFASMFRDCFNLQFAPELDTSSGTSFTGMFYNCFSLQSVPELDTSSGTNFGTMLYACYSLRSIPELDTSNGTNFSSMLGNCHSLQDAPIQGTTISLSVASTLVSRQALVRLFNGLGTANGTQTVTITGTPGASQLDAGERAIATGKGWTIVG